MSFKSPPPDDDDVDRPSFSSSSSARPSPARVSMMSTGTAHSTNPPPPPPQPAYYASWESSELQQSNDIRGDLATGWGQPPRHRQANNDNNDDSMNDHDNNGQQQQQPAWGWRLHDNAIQPVPQFYPLDPRSIRRIHLGIDDSNSSSSSSSSMGMGMMDGGTTAIEEISHRISTACQSLSIHGVWDNARPSTTLSSMEQVEMEINLYWSEEEEDVVGAVSAYSSSCSPGQTTTPPSPSPPRVVLVELQRRKGCSITFHNYRKCLLDAAEGKFDMEVFARTDGLEKPMGRDRCHQPRATLLARPSLRPSSYTSSAGYHHHASSRLVIGGLKTEGESSSTSNDYDTTMQQHSLPPSTTTTHQQQPMAVYEKAMKALNMAASLLHKDRVDARRLGMESLVLLTDPLRAGMETAHIASRVVLLGSAQGEHPTTTSEDDDVDALFDESSGLGIREKILEMILTDGGGAGSDEQQRSTSGGDTSSSRDGFEMIEREFTDCLFNLCLTVLSNALQTMEGGGGGGGGVNVVAFGESIEEEEEDTEEVVEDRKLSPRARASTEPAVRPSASFPMEHQVSKRFIDDTNSTFGCDVLSSLIRILGQAKTNPHDAYHSARCLGVLFKGCGNSHKARARRDLDAKRIIAAALEVGARSHAKLADASREAMVALVTDDEESMEEERSPRGGGVGGERMDMDTHHP